ncbi:hypothetical protein D918_09810 [Trichuris suis]|nr:hypothetical protein D918_09810 [Trichuris suis]
MHASEDDREPSEDVKRHLNAEEDLAPTSSTHEAKKLKTASSPLSHVDTDYRLYLTTVATRWTINGMPAHLASLMCWLKTATSWKEVLRYIYPGFIAVTEGSRKFLQFNYTVHPDWLLSCYPEQCRHLPLLIVTSRKSSPWRELKSVIKKSPNVQVVLVPLEFTYGSHHSKMILLKYSSGIRVVIHTANLVEHEWMYVSPIYPPIADDTDESDSHTNFKKDLLAYLRAYNDSSILEWCDIVNKHDFRQAKVYFVASVPGWHQGENLEKWGHPKMRQLLRDHLKVDLDESWPLICQFSAFGFLGTTADQWLLGELFSNSLKQTHGQQMSASPNVKLIYPCVEDVRCSLEGYDAGCCLPYTSRMASKQDYLKQYLHRWRSERNGRSRACPHTKSYLRCNGTFDKLAWYYERKLVHKCLGSLRKRCNADSYTLFRSWRSFPAALFQWCDIVNKHDFRQAKVYFVASVPGWHQGENLEKWGHPKMRQLLRDHLKVDLDESWPLICQFSAFGFLGTTADQWLLGELFSNSLKQTHGQQMSASPNVKLIYPCVEDVRCSLEGYDAGCCLPYTSRMASKQDYLKQYLHRWRSERNGRSRACPHTKSYLRCNGTFDKLACANLSTNAWGRYENDATQILIRSFEVGVLFLPHCFSTTEDDPKPSEKIKRQLNAEEDLVPTSSAQAKRFKTTTSSPLKHADSDYRLYLTTVANLDNKWNASALGLADVLAQNSKELESSAQFNFMIDPEWLLSCYPKQCRHLPLLIVTSRNSSSWDELKALAKRSPNVQLVDAPLPIPFGSHHSKMILLKYSSGIQVVVHTANLIDGDWIYISPIYPPIVGDKEESDSHTNFKKDLLAYLRAYKNKFILEWCDIISKHDFRQAKVYFVASVPGRHQGENMENWGHPKLQCLLRRHLNVQVDASWPLVCQFSSIGSLGSTADKWLLGEFSNSLKQTHGQQMSASPNVKLIYPCVEDVRCSLEGYEGGGCLPYSYKTAFKQDYLKRYLHRWRSERNGRSRACPHIKSYLRCNGTFDKLAWFLLTSANLSKAAWGCYEKNATQIFIRSFEVGVLFLPHSFNQDVFALNKKDVENEEVVFPMPYDLPPARYDSKDEPWIIDIAYLDDVDSHGSHWDP